MFGGLGVVFSGVFFGRFFLGVFAWGLFRGLVAFWEGYVGGFLWVVFCGWGFVMQLEINL